MDGEDQIPWQDDPEEYENDDDEAENLHYVIDVVESRLVDPQEIKEEVSGMRQRLERDVSASEAAEVEVVVDRQQQDNSNEVIRGSLQELTDAVNRLRAEIQAQPEGRLGMSARNWQRVKYIAAAGLGIYAFTSDTFQIISFIQAAVTGSFFLRTMERLYEADDPAAKTRQAVIDWVNQDENSFWKSQADYYVPKTKYSLMAQINNAQMMMYVAGNSSKLNPVIRWDAAEKLAIVQGLSKTYLNMGSRAMYLSVTSYEHEGKPIPRVAALGCVSLALALVIEHLQAKSGNTIFLRSNVAGATLEATDRPAKHFEPIFVFQKVFDPDLELRDYARLITKAWNVTMHISQKDEPTRDLFLHNSPKDVINDELIMDDASKVLSNFTDTTVRSKIQKIVDRFLAMCSTTYPLLPGETITEHHLAMLTAPYRYAVPGAIAYVRTTNEAETVFIAHQVRFDVSTGHPTLVYHQATQIFKTPITKMVRFSESNLTEADFFKTYIGPVAQTLAFALPPPWNVFGAAGFQILDEIFGSFGSGPNLALVIKNLLEETVQAMKNLLLDDAVRQATNSINAFIEWVSIATTGLDSLTSDNEIWINQTLDTLGDVNNPSFTGNILNDLIALTSPELCTIQRDEVISLAFMAASSLFFSYRLRCQLYSLLASFAQSKKQMDEYDRNAGEFYILTTEFEVTLQTWVDTLKAKVDDLVKARKDCVTPVHYYDNRSTQCHSHGGPAAGTSCYTSGDDGYACEDTFLGTTPAKTPNNRWTSGCCHQNDHCDTFEDQVNAARNNYLADLDKALNVKYADHFKTIDEWNASLGKVKAMMPPKQPAAPTISTWLQQAPDPDLQGKQVQYLVEFVNNNGPSSISPGSGFASILTGEAPQVSIPIDPNGAATKRNIYRQLIDSSGTTRDREKVDIVNNNTTQIWVDGKKLLRRGLLGHSQPPYRPSRL